MNGLIILYVTENDAKYLNDMDQHVGTVWITTKEKIPHPLWKCETDCIYGPRIG